MYTVNIYRLLQFLDGKAKGNDSDSTLGSHQAKFNLLVGEELALKIYQHYLKHHLCKTSWRVEMDEVPVQYNNKGRSQYLDGIVLDSRNMAREICEVKSWSSSNGYSLSPDVALEDVLAESARGFWTKIMVKSKGFEEMEKILYKPERLEQNVVRTLILWRPVWWGQILVKKIKKNDKYQVLLDGKSIEGNMYVKELKDIIGSVEIKHADIILCEVPKKLRELQGKTFYQDVDKRELYKNTPYYIFSCSNYLRYLLSEAKNKEKAKIELSLSAFDSFMKRRIGTSHQVRENQPIVQK